MRITSSARRATVSAPRCRRIWRAGPKLPRNIPLRDERGAGSVLGITLVAAMLALASLCLPLYMVLAQKQRVAGAADAAVLAAADAASGAVAGEPCTVAAELAAANGARLESCELDGLVATVSARLDVAGLPLTARATAGPPAGRSRTAHPASPAPSPTTCGDLSHGISEESD